MIVLAVVVGVLIVLVRVRMLRRYRRDLDHRVRAASVIDTGARSPFRAPRGVRFHKGF